MAVRSEWSTEELVASWTLVVGEDWELVSTRAGATFGSSGPVSRVREPKPNCPAIILRTKDRWTPHNPA